MQQLIRNAGTPQKAASIGLTVIFVAAFVAGPMASANPNGAITIDGTAIQGGSDWSPDIPLTSWYPFQLTLPPGAQYTDSTDAVSATLTVSVVDPATLAISYPKNRTPLVVYEIDGSGTELDTPMTLTWPNIHNYPVGEAHLVYVYDAALGTWDVGGAATVSTDGLTLEQPTITFNTQVSYYFVDQNVLLNWPGGS